MQLFLNSVAPVSCGNQSRYVTIISPDGSKRFVRAKSGSYSIECANKQDSPQGKEFFAPLFSDGDF